MRKNPQIKLVLFTKNLESLLKHCLLYKCMKNIFKLFLLSPVVFSTIGCQNKPEEPKELKPIDWNVLLLAPIIDVKKGEWDDERFLS